MISKSITLSDGGVVRVCPVPQKVYDVVRMRYSDPPVPFIEDSNTATGEPVRMENRDDPTYRLQRVEIEQKRMTAWAEAQLLFGLPDVVVPDGWQPPTETIQYLNPEWKPRDTTLGHRLDYIEWEVLRNPADHQRVIRAINDLASIDEEVAEAIEDSFPGDVEGEAA